MGWREGVRERVRGGGEEREGEGERPRGGASRRGRRVCRWSRFAHPNRLKRERQRKVLTLSEVPLYLVQSFSRIFSPKKSKNRKYSTDTSWHPLIFSFSLLISPLLPLFSFLSSLSSLFFSPSLHSPCLERFPPRMWACSPHIPHQTCTFVSSE